MNRSGVFVQLFLAVVVSVCVFGLMTGGLFMLVSRYQMAHFVSDKVDPILNQIISDTEEYFDGNATKSSFINTINELDTSIPGSINIFDGEGNIIYGQGTYVAVVPEQEDKNQFFRWSMDDTDDNSSFTQLTTRHLMRGDEIIAIILFSHESISSDFLRRSFDISLFFAMLVILPFIIIMVLAALYRIQQPITRFRHVVLQVAQGNYEIRAEEDLPGEVGELAMTINYLTSNLKNHISQLRFERNKLNHILDSLSEGIFAVHVDGSLSHANKAAYYMLGQYRADSEERVTWDELYSRFIDEKKVTKALTQGEIVTYTLAITDDKIVRINITPLIDDKIISGATILIQDITEFERLEKTRREYVSNVSHELRTPLTAMRGLIEPLYEGMVTSEDDKKRYYGILQHETIRLSNLINDLLELSHLQSGKDVERERQFYIGELITYIFDKYEAIANNKSIELLVDTDKTISVTTREDRIEQLLIILLDNALKFSPEGGKVGIDFNKNGDKLYVTVWDTGQGISKEDIPYVFDRFFTVDRSHSSEGTGLGLAIAKEIVHNMGEEIYVTCNPGEGARFTFTITDI